MIKTETSSFRIVLRGEKEYVQIKPKVDDSLEHIKSQLRKAQNFNMIDFYIIMDWFKWEGG